MKNISSFITVILSLITFVSYAQKDTLWFDSNWKETTKNKASYYRCNCVEMKNGYWLTDYYLSGAKQMEGLSLEKNAEVYHGTVKWYYENGNLFQDVNYKNGVLFGDRKVYFENGKLKNETTYKNGEIDGEWKEYYENGNTRETGTYEKGEKEGLWKYFYKNGKLKEEGKFVFDKKVDVWKSYFYDGTPQE